jgi:hypothetical protein
VSTTRYDGAQWDTFGIYPDPFVQVVVGSSSATPIATSGSGTDTYTVTFDGGPTATDVRASELQSFVGFIVWDDDEPADEAIGYCGSPAPDGAFVAPQTTNCPVDAATMNSGFTLTWHLERF